ncbi:MAG TPA: hypothetical protein PLM30_04085 [Synergistales bacterium]|jgi:hypothetical protein|nr:hypothetical protein [Synergistales bacterium]
MEQRDPIETGRPPAGFLVQGVPDAGVDESRIRVGYEIDINRYFYK